MESSRCGRVRSWQSADVHGTAHAIPPRLLVTSSRSVDGVRKNMIAGLKSLDQHDEEVERIVLANPAVLNGQQREKLKKKARELGITIEAFHDRDFFVSKLRRDGEWRKALLGLAGEPISLWRTPADLAESQWASLPLIGRDPELAVLQASDTDVILTGPPGVGKTRVVAALAQAVFVDVDAAESARLADDLRWLRPERLVVDDAGQHVDLVRRLVKLRRSESDLLDYRIICICWPDEVDAIKDAIPSANLIEIQLLEPQAVDQLIVSMGVRNQLARHEILDQAEGRPGWAIALADILTKTLRWDSLSDGRVLLGQVERYLRRARVGTEAIDLLTMIASLGGVVDGDIPTLAAALNLAVPRTRHLLLSAARSGLLDTSTAYDRSGRSARRYDVRPPMLADALVAEHAFRSAVPATNLLNLAEAWPGNLGQITESAIDSTLLGAAGARPVAAELLHRYRDGNEGTSQELGVLARRYACIDSQAGREVLSWAHADFDHLCRSGDVEPRHLETIVELAALVARRHLLPGAVDLLLDAATLDARPTNQHPHHPLRELEDLIIDHHPDLEPAKGLRQLVADAIDAWLGRHNRDPRAWEVYAAAISSVLSLHRSGRYLDAADRRQMHMIESVAPPTEIKDVYENVWPTIKGRLGSAPSHVVRDAIDAATDWLHIGGGHDRPFGNEHPEPSIKAAKWLGTKLLRDLVPVVAGKPELTVYLRRSAAWFGINLRLQIPNDLAVLFVDIERGEDWQRAMSEAWEAVKTAARPWASEDPTIVVQRLVDLRSQLDIARLNWPNRVEWACQAISDCVSHPVAWVEAALAGSLFPEAEPFLRVMLSGDANVPAGLIERCIDDSRARWRAVDAVLSLQVPAQSVQYVLASLQPSDLPVLETLAFQKRLSVERQRDLLTIPTPEARGAAAFAMARPVHDDDGDWPPAEIESEWLAAIQLLDPSVTPRVEEYHLRSLFGFLKNRYPATLVDYMGRRLQDMVDRDIFIGEEELVQGLHLLPRDAKTQFFMKFGDSRLRWFLLRYMPGDDIAWIEAVLDRGLMTTDEALKTRDGFGPPEPSIVDLAKLLIPRGVEPANVAAMAQFGLDWGEESDRASKLLTQFQAYAESDDDSVAAVGRAGVEIYTKKRDVALQRERIERVRGEI